MEDFLTVKEVAEKIGKSEETVKRWVRAGKFPNSTKESDKKGWQIPLQDIQLLDVPKMNTYLSDQMTKKYVSFQNKNDDTKELIILAYQAVTTSSPSETIINLLNGIGIKRSLEILLIMQQSPTKVKNQEGFIKKAIRENWSPNSVPIKMSRKQSKRIYELTQQEFEGRIEAENHQEIAKVPFYNWLED